MVLQAYLNFTLCLFSRGPIVFHLLPPIKKGKEPSSTLFNLRVDIQLPSPTQKSLLAYPTPSVMYGNSISVTHRSFWLADDSHSLV